MRVGRIVFILTLIFCFWMTVAMAKTPASPPVIAIHQFVEHPALDAVQKGFKDALKAKKFPVQYKTYNAQANMATTGQIAQVIGTIEPDLVLAIATPSAQASAQIMRKMKHMNEVPLLFSAITDPKGAGLVTNLEKPGKYITGTSDMIPMDKHVDFILEAMPKLKKLGVVYNPGEANSKALIRLLEKACKKRKVRLIKAAASKTAEVYQAGKSVAGRVDALYVSNDNTVVAAFESLVKVCEQSKKPLFAADIDSVSRGAVAALGFDYYRMGYDTGEIAMQVLQGTHPGSIPVKMQETMQLHLNLQAASKQGIIFTEAIKEKAVKIID